MTKPAITGYRELSQYELDLINKIKALSPVLEEILGEVSTHLSTQQTELPTQEYERWREANPYKWKNIATDNFQIALMALVRAVAQPTTF